MLKARYKRYAGIFLWLLCEGTASADSTQAWTLSDPDHNQSATHRIDNDSVNMPVLDYARSVAQYSLPNVRLVDQESHEIDIRGLIEYGGPVMMQFIFVTCSTVCPVLSASFASAQHDLDAAGQTYRFISISIDPEQDTPEKLDKYAKRFKAGKNWYFLTGSNEDITKLLKTFNAWYSGGNKMYHKPLTFMLAHPGANWIRIEGLMSKNDVIREYQSLLNVNAQSGDSH